MNQNERTKTVMMISNRKKPLVSTVFIKTIQRFKGLRVKPLNANHDTNI